MKRIFLILVLLCFTLTISGCKKEKCHILDKEDNVIAETNDTLNKGNINNAYIDVTMTKALEILMKEKDLEKEQAKKDLYNNNYKIFTYCDTEIINNIDIAFFKNHGELDFGCAITDLNGNLIAVYSSSDNMNFSTQKNPPYSTIKPLAVYCQALENSQINWSSTIVDSPFKKIDDGNGGTRDWPTNATNVYLFKPVTIYDAVKESLNTVSVKVLNEYGVKKSMDFLKEKFDFNIKTEEYKGNIFGEEEVIGNIALGYTVEGESPIDMAGYYQIFANGGNYTRPNPIRKIIDKNGKVIYENQSTPQQIISEETSCIMNKLLQGVVTIGGTGEDAYCKNVEVAGKTGTGDLNSGNWFVGVTPEYSCAIWHSKSDNNYAAKIFSAIFESSAIKIKDFRTSPNVIKKIYCKESGKLLGEKCTLVDMGYYAKDNIPDICNLH